MIWCDIPVFLVLEGRPFIKSTQENLLELAARKNNAQEIFVSIALEYPSASSIGIQLPLFDIGIYISIRSNETHQDLNSIGLGMAAPEGSVNDMYFCVNHWSHTAISHSNPSRELSRAAYWNQANWTAAVLPLAVMTASAQSHDQQEIVHPFFDLAIKVS